MKIQIFTTEKYYFTRKIQIFGFLERFREGAGLAGGGRESNPS
jgi:hypothetical protein